MTAQETFGANFFETTVTTEVGANDLTANVAATSGLAVPCYVVFDPDVPARREIWLVDSSVTATTLVATNINKRYLTGSAAGSGIVHPVGSVVRCAPVFQHFTDINDRVDAAVARANHTGTQLAATISDLETVVKEYARDALGTALTEGANIDVTVNDAGDTITLAVTGSVTATIDVVFLGAPELGATSGSPSLSGAVAGPHGVAWLLDAASTEVVSGATMIPTGWSTADLELWWFNVGPGAGDVRFDHYVFNDGDGEAISGPPGTPQTVTAGAASTMKKTTLAAGVAVTAGEVAQVSIWRVGGNAADTLTNDIGVVGVCLRKVS